MEENLIKDLGNELKNQKNKDKKIAKYCHKILAILDSKAGEEQKTT